MPSIKSLRAFVLTMEHGSLTLASKAMNLSQPAASRLLQQLEEEFGAPLFYRDSKTLTPSRDAELFHPEASCILASFEELPEIMRALKQDAAAPLKVIGQTRCVQGLVAPALARLVELYPDVAIDLATHKRAELQRRLVWDRFDVGVFALPLHIDFAEVLVQRQAPCGVLVPRAHPLAEQGPVTPEDLLRYDRIAVSTRSSIGEVEDEMARHGYSLPVKHSVTNAFAAISLVRHGLGYLITDRFTVDPINLSALTFVPITPTPAIEYAICASPGFRAHPMKRPFVDLLTELLETPLSSA